MYSKRWFKRCLNNKTFQQRKCSDFETKEKIEKSRSGTKRNDVTDFVVMIHACEKNDNISPEVASVQTSTILILKLFLELA